MAFVCCVKEFGGLKKIPWSVGGFGLVFCCALLLGNWFRVALCKDTVAIAYHCTIIISADLEEYILKSVRYMLHLISLPRTSTGIPIILQEYSLSTPSRNLHITPRVDSSTDLLNATTVVLPGPFEIPTTPIAHQPLPPLSLYKQLIAEGEEESATLTRSETPAAF